MSGHSDQSGTRGYRFPADLPASVRIDGRPVPCVAANLSRTGVLLIGRFDGIAPERLDLTLKTQNGSLEVRLEGRLVREYSDPTREATHWAVEFADLDAGLRDQLEVFLARLIESHPVGPLDHLKPGASPQDIKKALDAIPLPQRIALAQRAELKQREVLRHDQHPVVLDTLVRHPNLTLTEARAIAASPFLQTSTIDLLAADPRFRHDDELRISLATHARVTVPTAERLTADLPLPQIKKLLTRPGLPPAVRDKLLKKAARG